MKRLAPVLLLSLLLGTHASATRGPALSGARAGQDSGDPLTQGGDSISTEVDETPRSSQPPTKTPVPPEPGPPQGCVGVMNRLQLDNGLDDTAYLSTPFVGDPIASGTFDPTDDLYWKVFPADALQRCSGTSDLMGIEASVFDTDFVATEALWAYTITPGVVATDQTIVPSFTGPAVFVPGVSTTGTIFGPPGGGCPPPGYVSGWTYVEGFCSTLGSPTPLYDDMVTDGSTDWVFTHYFPGPGLANMNLGPGAPLNSCGTTGDATLQWCLSADGPPTGIGTGGENQPDWTMTGNSIYGGFSYGGDGSFVPIPEDHDRGAELAWFFAEPTIQVRFDAGAQGDFGVEVGLGALETPLQVSSGGVSAGGTTTIGVRFYDQAATTVGTDFMMVGANVTPPFIDSIGCLPFGNSGALLGLDVVPGSGFPESFAEFSFNTPWFVDSKGETVNDSLQIPVGTSAAYVDLEISWQAWRFDAVAGDIVSASNVFRTTMRANDGL